MDLGLNGRRALVLAASSGLGRATATELAREGARVALCSRDLERARAAADEIAQETGGEVHAFEADVADGESLAALFENVVRELGGLDVLVANAGGPPFGGFESLNESDWDRAYQLTLMSVARAARLAIPHFREAGGGSILALASSSVVQPIPNLLLSNVFRPAVRALCKHLAEEMAGDGVRVNVLSPGRIHTERTEALDASRAERSGRTVEEVRAETIARIPLGRLGEPAEFGRVAAFLSSPAASYLTGIHVLADGGMVRAL
jgi:3-oxoacyl-[acyl-carrier protein] reductase